jgi:peptide/nickel transport system permease protein
MTATYLGKRLLYGAFVILGVATIVFVATHLLADPARKMLPLSASHEQYVSLRHSLGLDKPVVTQFWHFLKGAVQLDFGNSISLQSSASHAVVQRLAHSFELVGLGVGLAVLIAIPLGILAATRPGSWLDSTTVATSLVGLSMPQFWLGALLILFFAVHLHWLPTSGAGGLKYLVLPVIALSLPIAGRVTQIVRSTVIDELNRQYVVAARAKGFRLPYILRRHVLRNALVPISSYVSLETAKAFAGATVVVETVFAYPGIGYLAVQASKSDDVILMEAIAVIVSVLVVATNLFFDIFQSTIDPRIRVGR